MGSLLFSFGGRINRSKYWLAALIYFAIGLVLGLIGIVSQQDTGYQIMSFIVNMALFVSALAVGTKRLHDRDRSGWWLVTFYFIPAVLAVVAVGLAISEASMVSVALFALAAAAVSVWGFVELGCLRGTIGSNAYGPDPLAKV